MSVDAYTPITVETRLSLPLNGRLYTTTRRVAPEKPAPSIGAAMTDELGSAWTDSLIVAVNKSPTSPQTQLVISHARIPSEAEQLSSNWEFSTCDMGGTRFPSVSRTFVLLASAVAHDTPAKGSAMPFVANDIFDGKGYILVDRQVVRTGMELEPTFRVERRNYVIRSAITQLGVDSLNGKVLTSTTTLYYSSEVVVAPSTTAAQLFANPAHAYWGLQTTGVQRSGQQLSCEWYSITEETVVSGTFALGAVTIRTYDTTRSYYWPPILGGITLRTWERRDGAEEVQAEPYFLKEGYNGECKAEVVDTFHVEKPTIAAPTVMLPLPISFQNPYIGSLRIGACLFAGGTPSFTNGNNDPVYKWFVTPYTIPATDPVTWPAFITIQNVQPFRGGYMLSTVKIYKPS